MWIWNVYLKASGFMKGLFHGEWRRGQMFHPETCWSWSRELFGEVLIILNYKESVIMTWGNDTSHTWVQCQPARQGWVYFYLINTSRRSPSYVMIDNPPSLFRVLSSVTVSQPPGNPNQQRIGQWQQLAADWTINVQRRIQLIVKACPESWRDPLSWSW